MNNTLSITDLIKKSVLSNFEFVVTPETMLDVGAKLLLSLAIGIVIYLLYKASFRGVVYSESFAITLIGMTVITSAILLAISSNIVLSLGCVGALSIVRYRTAIKSPMDLMFLFLAIGVGICTGAGLTYLSIFVVLTVALLLLIMSRFAVSDEVYVLIVHYTGDDLSREIRSALGTVRYKVQSQTMRKNDAEMAIEVRVKKHNLSFAEKIRAMDGVTDITLVQYNGDYIG